MFNEKNSNKLYLNYHGDGLLDIFLGLAAIWFGITIATDTAAYMAIAFILFYSFGLVAKQIITMPRLRPDEVSLSKTTKLQRTKVSTLSVTLLIGLLFFVLTYLLVFSESLPFWLDAFLDNYLTTMVLFVVIGIMAYLGYAAKVWRLIGYAGLMLLAFISYLWFPLDLSVYAFALGGFVLLVGVVLLVQFLNTHPQISLGGS